MPISDHKNFAISTLASPPSGTGGTSLTVASGHGALFPAAPFNVTVWPAGVQPTSSNAEIMRVTNKASDVFTVTRAQEGTSGRTHSANDQIAATITKRVLTDVEYGAHGVINVMDPVYGAVGDGVTDDTAAIQAAIDTRGSIFFPPGTYRITDTLTLPSATAPGGGWWKGSGMSRTNPQVSTRVGPSTVLMWDGAIGGTMIEWSGVAGWRFEDMAFVGRPTSGDSNRAGILMHAQTNASFGTAYFGFTHCAWFDADVCVQFGTASGDADCDTAYFIGCSFQDSTRGFVSKNVQALLYSFLNLNALNVTSVVDMENGGSLLMENCNIANGGGSGADEYAIRIREMAVNTHTATITGLRAEQNTFKVLSAEQYGRVFVNSYYEGQDTNQQERMFRAIGTTIQFESCHFRTYDATTPPFYLEQDAGGYRGAMLFNACTFFVTPFVFAEWFAYDTNDLIGIKATNCAYATNASRLPDFGNVAEWGAVTHTAATTNATPTYAYLDGGASATAANTLRIPSDSLWLFDVFITGSEVGGGADVATFHRRCTIKDVSGTTTQIGSTQTIGTDENADAWAVAINVQNGFIRAQVTGAASTTIDWRVIFVPTALVTAAQ